MARWEYMVAKNEEEFEKGNFEDSFETQKEAEEFAKTLGEEAIVSEIQIISEA